MSACTTTCPACNSEIRFEDGRVEIVRIEKPSASEIYTTPVPIYRATPARRRVEAARARAVIIRIAAEAGLSLDEISSPSRRPELVAVRRRAASAARNETWASLAQIGRILNRDHSTIHAGLRQLETAA